MVRENLILLAKNYINKETLIAIDEQDLNYILDDATIVNFYYGNINLKEEIHFNFIKCDDSNALLFLEMNSIMTMQVIDKLILSIKKYAGDINIIYGLYYNDNIDTNSVNLLFINTEK